MTLDGGQRLELRPVGPADARVLAENLVAGLRTYRSFAPAGWEPPSVESEVALVRERLDDRAWGRIALVDGAVAGHVLFIPAPGIPRWAHIAGLFVGEPWWGSGLAATLLSAAVDEMRAQGYERARLYTAEGQARARRFYEREGWVLQPGRVQAIHIGLELVEYQRALSSAGPPG